MGLLVLLAAAVQVTAIQAAPDEQASGAVQQVEQVTGLDVPTLPEAPQPDSADDEAADAQEEAEAEADEQEAEAEQASDEAADDGKTAADPVLSATNGALHEAEAARRAAAQKAADVLGELDRQVLTPVRQTADEVSREIGSTLAPEPTPAEPAADVPAPVVVEDAAQFPAIAYVAAAATAAGTIAVFWIAGSSGSAAAGTAGAKAIGSEMRRLLPFASPLFTRFERDTVLGHPKREALYALILQEPGVSLQSLCESTGLSRTAVTHHLRLMEMQHLVVSKRRGRTRHYFENGGRFGREQKDAYAVLQNGRSKEVATFIQDHPGSLQKELCAALGLQPSVVHWHVRRLKEGQLVEEVREGRTVRYFPGGQLRQVQSAVIPAAEPEVLPMPAAAAPVVLPGMPA